MTRIAVVTAGLLVALAALAVPAAVTAQSFPSKAVRIVVPYPAGGATDYVTRLIGERLSRSLGQPVIVENKSGAAGAIGVSEVARAEPDGHTILFTINDPLVNNTALFKKLPYDPRKDLVFVAQILRSPALVSAGTGAGIADFAALRERIAKGAQMTYASWGIGGLGHLAGESLNRALQAGMVHVPQRGEGPVVQDLLSNTVTIGLSSVATALQHVAAGKIVPLAMMGSERSTALPQVPTLQELGFDDPLYAASVWMAALVPSGTPPAVVAKLSTEIRAIADGQEVRKALIDRGFEMMVTTPEQARTNYIAEFQVITDRIRELGIEPQ
jgi:tripartite-type tricarboxylate transporter receptor subunit TctC